MIIDTPHQQPYSARAASASPEDVDAVAGITIVRYGETTLGFMSQEVVQLQAKGSLKKERLAPLSVGSVVHNKKKWPVFGLANDYRLLESPPDQNAACVCLSPDNGVTGIAFLCDSIKHLNPRHGFRLQAIPDFMRFETSPITHWAAMYANVITIVSCASMTRYIKSLIALKTE